MIRGFSYRFWFFYLGLFFSTLVHAADPAQEWLMKINHAARNLDYDGVFVYQHDTQLEAMRIIHKAVNNSSKERLVSLNGAPREVIRDDREVRCYWPDKNSVMVEFRKAGSSGFPAILPERLQDLEKYYVIKLGKEQRIIDRMAQLVIVKPMDNFRYGYHLWADKESGLLLKADLLNINGKMLEQFMFTQVNIGGAIPDAALTSAVSTKSMVWYREEGDSRKSPAKPGWTITSLPKGFMLSAHMLRQMPMRKQPVEHLVYTDGLAAVSIFVEKQEKGIKPVKPGTSSMGAVHAYGTNIGEYQITAVGAVPASTVSLIGGSVVPAK
jgi:sigma-E factor negative regulatory protein RseB